MTDYTIGDIVKEAWQNFTDHPAVKYPLVTAATVCMATEMDALYGLVSGDNALAHISGLYDKDNASAFLLNNADSYNSDVRFLSLAVLVFLTPLALAAYMYLDELVMRKLSDNG